MSKIRQPYKAVLTVAAAAAKKNINNPYQLHKKTGGKITFPRAKKLWIGEGKFDLEDLTILCNCLPCGLKDIIKLQHVAAAEADDVCNQE